MICYLCINCPQEKERTTSTLTIFNLFDDDDDSQYLSSVCYHVSFITQQCTHTFKQVQQKDKVIICTFTLRMYMYAHLNEFGFFLSGEK